MANRILTQRLGRTVWSPGQKPPYGARVNPFHPLSQGLIGAWLFNEGGGKYFYNNVDSFAGDMGTSTWIADSIHIADGTASPNLPSIPLSYMEKINRSKGITVFGIWKREVADFDLGDGLIMYGRGGVILQLSFAIDIMSDGRLRCYFSDSGSYNANYDAISSTALIADNIEFSATFKWIPGDKGYLFHNGNLVAQSSSSPTTLYSPTVNGLNWNTAWDCDLDTYTMPGECKITLFYNRPLLDIEIASLHANPYQMFWNPVWDAFELDGGVTNVYLMPTFRPVRN